jgi:hydroxyacylglutathione hydrolase
MMSTSVHTLRLKVSNAVLILGDRPILIDSGSPGDLPALERRLAEHRVQISDLAAIIHTHGHADHVGTTAALAERSAAARDDALPIVLHSGDAAMAASGKNTRLKPTSPFAYVIRLFTNPPFDPFVPTTALTDSMRLDAFGVGGSVMAFPGHTPGSVVVLLDSGEAVVGDLFRGGFMGGALAPRIPKQHYFADDRAMVADSIRELLRHDISIFHVGHGGPIPGSALQRKWGNRT